MKTLTLCLLISFVIGITSCSDTQDPMVNNISVNEDTLVSSLDVLPPSIGNISGTLGYSNGKPYASYPNHYAAEYNGGSTISFTGSNFGNTQGSSTLKFEMQVNGVWQPVPNYAITIISWKNSAITIKLKVTSTQAIPTTGRLKITTSGGAGTKPFQAVPYLYTRQYGQCTWWCTKRTMEVGLPGTNAHYSMVTTPTNAIYDPTAKDLLSWGVNVHEAFIESVNKTYEAGNITKYVLTISESNVANTFPTYYTTTIKVKTVGGVRSFVSPYNKYRSTLQAGAPYCRAQ